MEELLSKENIDLILSKIIEWCIAVVPQLLITVLLFIVIRHFLKKAIKHIERKMNEQFDDGKASQDEKEKRATTLINLLQTIANSIIWAIFIISLLKIVGVDVTTILGSAGILSLAISFGAQELVRDGIAGFFLLLEDRVRVGDVATINGVSGKVESIDLRTITLRNLSGVIYVFQNGKIDTLANLTKDWSAMVFDIGVAYKEDMDEVIKVVERVGNELQQDENFT
ncbi:MAG: mechanosensitive ion channel domain-containing protein [Bacteroidota bacterium]